MQEGILTSIPYAGTFVIDVTAKDIEDAYSLNKVLDEFAIEQNLAELRDERFFDELDRRHRGGQAGDARLDTTRQIETALQLHGLIYEWADNSVLLETWQRLTSRLQMYFALHQRARNEPVPAEDLHEDYVRAAQGQGHARRPEAMRREHIGLDFEELISYARSLEQRTPSARRAAIEPIQRQGRLTAPESQSEAHPTRRTTDKCASKPSRPIASCSLSSTGPIACRRAASPTRSMR